eukprot:CAMPEP_0176062816 /NCGR_PEP_ID=MMETSP0120_2-20121206/31325_1 /TAXON_ID=160619 /ORGANISM="Kryptoperidinium foliaceum, Strain CCMP 1326" /LENGTH=424 /DNA_ID=CAMNT_0017396383 /DNA_START=82 /DNA_END=1353 /DNA_ORIENTATION=+
MKGDDSDSGDFEKVELTDYDEGGYGEDEAKCNGSKRPLITAILVTTVFALTASFFVRNSEGVPLAATYNLPLAAYPGVRDPWRQCSGGGRPERYTDRLHMSFLMLTMEDIAHADLWLEFFKHAPAGSYSAYVHCKFPEKCSANFKKTGLDRIFKIVPAVYNAWCQDLLSPMIQLLRFALPDTAVYRLPSKFIFVSSAHLPMKPFSVMRAELGKHPETSEFCMYPTMFWDWLKADPSTVRVTANQWSILTRQDAETLVQRMPVPSEGSPIKVPAISNMTWDDFDNHHCIDEAAVFVTIFGVTKNVSESGEVPKNFYPGIGEVNVWEPREQGCCRTWEYLSIHTTDEEDEARIQWFAEKSTMATTLLALRKAADSQLVAPITHCDVGCEIVWQINDLGPEGQRILRESPFLFARKVAANATLTGFA